MKFTKEYRACITILEEGQGGGPFKGYIGAYENIGAQGYLPVLEALHDKKLSPSSSINGIKLYDQAYRDEHFDLVLYYVKEGGIKSPEVLFDIFTNSLRDFGALDLANPATQERKEVLKNIIDTIIGHLLFSKSKRKDRYNIPKTFVDRIDQVSHDVNSEENKKEFEKLKTFIDERMHGLSDEKIAALDKDKSLWKETFFSHHESPEQNKEKENPKPK